MKFPVRSALLLSATLASAGLIWLVDWTPASASPAEPRALPVQVQKLARVSEYTITQTHSGRVVNRRASALGFDRAGRIDAVLYDEGDRVAAGQVLARLDARELRSQHRQAAAEVRRIEAELAFAHATTLRRNKLHEADQLAQQQLDEAVYSEDALQAQIEAARAAVENLDVRLDLSEIRASYDGVIDARYVDEGTVVGAGEPILRIVEDLALEVQMGVPPAEAAELEVGSRHTLVIDDHEYPAILQAVLPTVETDTRTVRVIFRLEAGTRQVRAGALARLRVESRVPGEGFWLPLEALAESRRGLWSAYVVTDDESGAHVDRRQVEVIHATANRVFVRGTLRSGEGVVAAGVHRLVPGMRVRVSSSRLAATH